MSPGQEKKLKSTCPLGQYILVFTCPHLNIMYVLVYTTQVNSTFRGRWLASSEVISQVLFISKQPKKTKMAFVAIF